MIREWNRDRILTEYELDGTVSNSDWGTKIILVSTCSRAHVTFCAIVTTHTKLCHWENHRKETPIIPLLLVPESRMHSFHFSTPKPGLHNMLLRHSSAVTYLLINLILSLSRFQPPPLFLEDVLNKNIPVFNKLLEVGRKV
jgi:hypothetical protein